MNKSFGLLASAGLAASALFSGVAAADSSMFVGRFSGVCEIPSAIVEQSPTAAWASISGSGTCTGVSEGIAGTFNIDLSPVETTGIGAVVPAGPYCVGERPATVAVKIAETEWEFYGTAVIFSQQALVALGGPWDNAIAAFDPSTSASFGPCGVVGTLRMSFGPSSGSADTDTVHFERRIQGITLGQVPSVPVGTPEVSPINVASTPEIPPVSVSTPALAPIPVATPSVPSVMVETPPVSVPLTCTPGNILCIGPFTIPSRPLATTPPVASQPIAITPAVGSETITTPGMPSQPVSTPGIAAQSIATTPTIGPLQVAPNVWVLVYLENGATFRSSVAQLYPTGPIDTEIPTPFGPIPVTVCGSTCPSPTPPDLHFHSVVTAWVQIGEDLHYYWVPIYYP